MKYGIETIDPEIAKEMLKGNFDNRAASKRHVDFLSAQMKSGKWKFGGDPIRIAASGRILDGQHRLQAIIQANYTDEFLVIREMDETVFDVLDTGKPRGAADVLEIKKIPQSSKIATLVSKILLYDRDIFFFKGRGSGIGAKKVSNSEILKYAESNLDRLHYLVKEGSRRYLVFKPITSAMFSFLQYLFDQLSEEDSAIFLDKLAHGTGLEVGSPILLLRNRFIEEAAAKTTLPERWKLALAIRAWNHFRQGNTLKVLQHATSSEFPKPI